MMFRLTEKAKQVLQTTKKSEDSENIQDINRKFNTMRTSSKDLHDKIPKCSSDDDHIIDEEELVVVEDTESGLSSSDFNCGVCYEILVLPTTLRCGHNFCKPCLASWYSIARKMECPVCRQRYHEKPAVNNLLRSLIEKTFKDEIKERTEKCLTTETKNVISIYDKAINIATTMRTSNVNQQRNGGDFCSGFLFMLGIVTIAYLVWYWRNIDDGLLVNKKVVYWSPDDVSVWLSTMPWTEPYRDNFLNKTIDGRLLLELNEKFLVDILNVTTPIHQAAILSAIDNLKDTGMKQPTTLWEYKSLHPGYSLFLLYGIKDYPRLTMLYLYWFDYYNMFLPFVHFTCPEEDHVTDLNIFEPLSNSQLIEFFTKMLFLPYLLVAQFTWEFLSIHYWTSRIVLINCIALTIIEAAGVRWFISTGRRDIISMLKEFVKGLLGIVVCITVWPIVPNFICDFFFYVALYFSPYGNCEKLYKLLREG